MRVNRRHILICCAHLPVLGLVSKSAVSACVDPDEMSDADRGTRESLEYTDAAKDAAKSCQQCMFFKPEAQGDTCGYCEILTGQVAANGHCDSWTPRS